MTKPTWAIKFRNYCFNNRLSAQDIASMLHLQKGSVYAYWSGKVQVPDENKKILEKKAGLDIYDIFFNEEL